MISSDFPRWQSVETGYQRHANMMAEIARERDDLLARGFLDPRDGFAAQAAEVAKMEFVDERNAAAERDLSWLVQIFSSTLQDVPREYAGADLTWSQIWIAYEPRWIAWLRDVSYFLHLARTDPEAMRRAMSIGNER